MKLTEEQLLDLLFNEIAVFLEELVDGNLDSYNIMKTAKELLKTIQGE